jgi:thiol:disulfide interchange protein
MKIIYSLLALFIAFLGQSQIVDPVKWKANLVKVSETEFDIITTANIQKDWHLYSQFTPEGGSMPLTFSYKNQKGNYELVGKTKEGKYIKKFSDVFEVDEYYFEGTAKFTQRIKVLNPSIKNIDFSASGQACIEGKCVNTDANLKVVLPQILKTNDQILNIETKNSSKKTSDSIVENSENTQNTSVKQETDNANNTVKDSKTVDKKSLWSIFLVAFLGGFAALLTPCVFPMIPMTVSFFTKQSKTKAEGIKNSFIYGISIIVIYVILGTVITAIFGAEALNALATNVWFNLIFFFLLLFFAASFLGAFEIVLPNSWANKIDKQADRGGILGIFFMALALAIVSFSCTGPIVGSLLVEASSKGGIAPIVGMLGFSLAIALPFMLFAMFPGWMNSLPKSGGWLNTVKVSLGFLELAFAFKFLSNADLVKQAHLLERETFLAIWIAIFAAWAIYLFGKISLPHDSPVSNISVGRLFLALLVSAFSIYLIPGLFGAPLKLISGFAPPITYSENPNGLGASSSSKSDLPEHAHYGPNGLIAFDDLKYGLAYAKQVNKPILLDFTGDACGNCRLMEANVWSKPDILSILQNKVVLVSLYCDRDVDLPNNEQYTSKITGKDIVTIGNKWTDYQITNYKSNTQPLYVIIDKNGNDLVGFRTISYETDANVYKKWLEDRITLASKK